MHIVRVRADGVVFAVDALNGKKIDHDATMPQVFLTWEDVDRIQKERADLEMVKYQNRRKASCSTEREKKASRKPRP